MRIDLMSVRRGMAFNLKGWREKLEGGDRLGLGLRLSKFGMTVQGCERVGSKEAGVSRVMSFLSSSRV